MKDKIICSADLHGNKEQFARLFKHALNNASAIIISGDITPKDPHLRTVEHQRKFITDFLIPQIKQFHRNNEGTCDIFLIMGNDDFKANYDYLKKNEDGYVVLDEKPLKWKEFILFGYSYVPYTPFICKDWEKADLIDKKETDRKDIVLEGVKSTEIGLIPHTINLDNREDCIEKDISDILDKVDPQKTILVVHSPPYNTALDRMTHNRHIGSKALTKIIKKRQPLLTLHGHIHECVKESGTFIERIGNTVCINPGNDHRGSNPAVVEIDPYNPQDAKRIIL